MARGTISKQNITNKILDTFEGSFLYNGGKEIRIPIEENGEIIQIKCVLTASKTNVNIEEIKSTKENNEAVFSEITEEEKTETINLIEKLGL